MNLVVLALKNMRFRWMTQVLTLLLFTLAISLLWVMHEVRVQSQNKLSKNLADIDLVIGAKGSPLQIILSSVYHIDAPTGNISYAEAKRWMKHPMVSKSLPLAYGDFYRSYKILGTDTSIISWYDASLAEGQPWMKLGEVVLGSGVQGLQVGDVFSGQHGDAEAESGHGDYLVVGILEPTGTVLDQLVLCGLETVWNVHEHSENGISAPVPELVEGPDEHFDKLSERGTSNPEPITPNPSPDREITALLLRYKNPMAAIQLPRMINESSSLQAAAPAIEINRLSFMLNAGSDTLKLVAYALLLLAAFSMLVQVWMGLSQRKVEFALLRSLGYSGGKLLRLLLWELGALVLMAFALGEGLARWFLFQFSSELGYGQAYSFEVGHWSSFDVLLLALPLALVLIAALVNARRIYQISISDLLQNP